MIRRKKTAVTGRDLRDRRAIETLREKPSEELMAEMEAYMQQAEEKCFAFDPAYLEQRLAVLQERDPVAVDFDPETEIRQLPLNVEGAHRHSRRRTLWRVAAIAAVLIALLAVGAGAGPFDLFAWLRRENADTITFHNQPSGEMNWEITDAAQQGEFTSLQEALDAYQVTTPLCPTWIPEDYRMVSLDVMVEDGMAIFSAAYESEERDGRFQIDFTRFRDGGGSITSEIDPEGEVYEKDGMEYFLFPNLERNKCHWFRDGFICVISGHLTFDELKQMVDSIPETVE